MVTAASDPILSAQSQRVLQLANSEARRSVPSSDVIHVEHLLLGLLREGESVAAQALDSFEMSLAELTASIQTAPVAASGPASPFDDYLIDLSVQEVIDDAIAEAAKIDQRSITPELMLLSLLAKGGVRVATILNNLGLEIDEVRARVLDILSPSDEGSSGPLWALSPTLRNVGRNLCADARRGTLDPVIGRTSEMERMMQVLSRRSKNFPLLIGEPGVGISEIVSGLAQEIVRGDVPDSLKNMQVYVLDLGLLDLQMPRSGSGPALRLVFEQIARSTNVVMFIDDIQTHLGANSGVGDEIGVGSVLRTHMTEGKVRLILGTTLEGFEGTIKRDAVLQQLLDPVEVSEPTVEVAIETLKGLRDRYEAHHRVSILDEALVAAVYLGKRFVTDRFLPESALDLLDEAGSLVRTKRSLTPKYVREFDDEIADVRLRKENAMDGQDFEAAARLRDKEKGLIFAKAEREKAWRSGVVEAVREVDEGVLVEVVARRLSKDPNDIQKWLIARTSIISVISERRIPNDFVLLNDSPVSAGADDLLGSVETSVRIASLLLRAPTPFVFALDASWGMGKSSLLRQIEASIPDSPSVLKVQFNAWTANGGSALEALIKSVLGELDSSLLRRWVSKVSKRRGLLGLAKIGIALLARVLGVGRIVDELWKQAGGDSRARDELRSVIQGMLTDWVGAGKAISQDRKLIVFVDDLDRCTDEVVVQVCEAVKLYLDAPGLLFVIACDMAVLERGVASAARGESGEGRVYLEKIVQVAHRMPPPETPVLAGLIRGYAIKSGTLDLIDETTSEILVDRCGGNPRRIKRILNSFVLEHRLDPSWSASNLGNAQLMSAVILQHLYPSFYTWLIREGEHRDPVGDFLEYSEVRKLASDPPLANDRWWSTTARVFRRHGIPVPTRESASSEMTGSIQALDALLPHDFPALASNDAFVALLERLGDSESRTSLRAQLASRPLHSAVFESMAEGSSDTEPSTAKS